MLNMKKILLVVLANFTIFSLSCSNQYPDNPIYTMNINFTIEEADDMCSKIEVVKGVVDGNITCYINNSNSISIGTLEAAILAEIRSGYADGEFPVNGVDVENTVVTVVDPNPNCEDGVDETKTTATITLKSKYGYVFQGGTHYFNITLNLVGNSGATFVPGYASATTTS